MAEHRWLLPPSVEAPALTRRLIATACAEDRVPRARVADCSLMATELVTNAVVHGRGEISLTVGCERSGRVRVEVRDAGGGVPNLERRRRPEDDCETGRGFLIVDALAERWGVQADAAATCAWFEVS